MRPPQIDEEVRRIIDECYGVAQRLLEENFDKLHAMAEALMLYETIDADQIDDIMAGVSRASPRIGMAARWRSSQAEPSAEDKDSGSPIGGPAGEH